MKFSHRTENLHTTVDLFPNLFGEATPGQTNLGPGDPRLPIPEHVVRSVEESIRDGRTGYTNASGIADLRAAVQDYFAVHHGVEYARSEVIVGVGSKQLLTNTLLATVNPGDEVILIAPYYPVYRQMVLFADGTPIVVPSRSDDGFRLPVEGIRSSLTDRTRWIIVNSPNNPSGVVCSKEELAALVDVVADHPEAGIISDQVYELLTFDGQVAPSSASVSEEGRRRTLAISGISKAYAMTGFRVGFAAGDSELMAMLARLSYVTTAATATSSQYAALAALTGPQDVVAVGQARGRHLAQVCQEVLEREGRLSFVAPQAGMYSFVDCSRLLGTHTSDGRAIRTDIDLVEFLAIEARTQLMPGTLFGCPGNLRVTFAVEEEEFRAALTRIVEVLKALK